MRLFFLFGLAVLPGLVSGGPRRSGVDVRSGIAGPAIGARSGVALPTTHAARSIFRSVSATRGPVERFGRFELTVRLDPFYANPYDYSEIALRCVFFGPRGVVDTVDGFYMADCRIDTVTGKVSAEGRGVGGGGARGRGADGGGWRGADAGRESDGGRGSDAGRGVGVGHFAVRYSPRAAGRWTYRLFCETKGGRRAGPSGHFDCLSGVDPGFVRAGGSPYLSFGDGSVLIPIGENMGWAQTNTYLDYRRWISRLAANRGNFIRVWMPAWGLGLEWLKGHNGFDGIGEYKQSSAALLDWLLDYCEEKNVYVLLSLDHHGQVSSRVDPNWNENPYNAANGGPCEHTWDFFTDARARGWIRNRFRYIVARYGYSTRILGWELFNEVDWTDDFAHHRQDVADWHAEMAAWLRRIDVYGHLITTSYGDARHDSLTWRLPGLDFTQTHYYTNQPLDSVLSAGTARYLHAYGKPTFTGEFGLSGDGKRLAAVDPDGVYIHNSLWASLLSGAMGPALPWYWDNYIDVQDLYGCFYGVASFGKGIDFIGHRYLPFTVRVVGDTAAGLGPGSYRAYALKAGDSTRLAAWLLKIRGGVAGGGAAVGGVGTATSGMATEASLGPGAAATGEGGDATVVGVAAARAAAGGTGMAAVAKGGVLEARGMRDGQYVISWWDCRRGVVVATDSVWVRAGVLRMPLPVIERDEAVTAERVSGPLSGTSKGSGHSGG